MVTFPRAVAYVDLTTLEENYRTIRAMAQPAAKVLCVVKADAYGHGAVEVSRRLEACGADYLGVANVEEGLELRQSGIRIPILVMGGVLPWDEIEPVAVNQLTPVVYDFQTLDRLGEYVENFHGPMNIHLKVDTGMGRLGFLPEEIPALISYLKSAPGIVVEGLMSHFSSSEMVNDYGMNQLRLFEGVLGMFSEEGMRPPIAHMANTGAIANYPESHFDMVRAGIALYGSYPAPELKGLLAVRPIMKLVSKVALIREFQPGSSLSYGGTYKTDKPLTRVAYIPFGYGDGYPRALSNRGSLLIQGSRCNIVGRVCMDWLIVDITHLDGVEVEEEAILMGQGAGDAVTADEIGELAGTIPYEILCRISRRILRVYV